MTHPLVITVNPLRDLWIQSNLMILGQPELYVEAFRYNFCFINQVEFQSTADGAGLDLNEVGYSTNKWKHFLRNYFRQDSFTEAMRGLRKYKGDAHIPPAGILFGKPHYEDSSEQDRGRSSYAGGPCLMSAVFSYQTGAKVPELTIFSRSIESARRMYVDLCFINVLCRTVGEEFGFSPEQVRVRWTAPRLLQMTSYVVPFLAAIGKEGMLKKLPKHDWTAHIKRKGIIVESDLQHKYLERKRAAMHYFKIKSGAYKKPLTCEALSLPVEE